jgi:hypothetical protein
MMFDFVGRSNQRLPDNIVFDEGLQAWRIISNGVLLPGTFTMSDAMEIIVMTTKTSQ